MTSNQFKRYSRLKNAIREYCRENLGYGVEFLGQFGRKVAIFPKGQNFMTGAEAQKLVKLIGPAAYYDTLKDNMGNYVATIWIRTWEILDIP